MPSPYSVTDHPLLSAKAVRRGTLVIDSLTRVAERLLGLVGTTYADSAQASAEDALAMQVSHMVEQGYEAYVLASEGRGSRTASYQDQEMILPAAQAIVDGLTDDAAGTTGVWPTIRSQRGNAGSGCNPCAATAWRR